MGRMGNMPRRTRPPPRLDRDLEIATTAFGSREALAILAFLGRVESAGAPEVCVALGMASNTVHGHLRQLEAVGLIDVDTPAGSRRGRTVRYALNRRATAAVADKLKAALLSKRRRV